MNEMYKVAAAAAFLALSAASAGAAPLDGVYVGGTIGDHRTNMGLSDHKDNTLDIFAGKKFAGPFGVEAGIVPRARFGQVTGVCDPSTPSTCTENFIKTTSAYVAGTAEIGVAKDLAVFGLAGVAYTKASPGESGVNGVVGAGVKYDVDRTLQLRVHVLGFNDAFKSNASATRFGIGAAYKF